MLEIRNLYKGFNGVHAVEGVSFMVQKGKITSLIGPNGAGKTTVFNIVTGFLPADAGKVLHDESPIGNLPPHKISRLGIARTFQNLRLFRKMSVIENVVLGIQHQSGELFFNALFRFSVHSPEHKHSIKRAEELLEFVGLQDHLNDLADNLSYGQQKLLSIACCLAADPKILLLDEPVAGVQPAMIEKIETILKQLVDRQGRTVFLIEHDMDFVLRISDTVIVMDDGKKITEAPPSAIRNNPEILEAYLI